VSAPLRAAFLAEAGPGVGLGHLRRCRALGTALSSRGAVMRLLVAGDARAAAPGATRFDWTRDPELTVETLRAWRTEVAVVDAYGASPELLECVAAVVALAVAVDDLADRRLPVHLVVNGAWHASRLTYRARPDTLFLLGPEYTLLDPAFAEAPRRTPRDDVRRVLLTLGGDPPADALAAALHAVRRAAPAARIDVALGPFAPVPDVTGEGVRVCRGLDSLRPLMLEADLAVTGGGVTLYECLATGVPVIGVCLADNQRPNIDELGRAGLILSGEPSLEQAIGRLAGDPALRRSMSVRGRCDVDGRGAARVADAIEGACVAVSAARTAR